MKTQNSFVVAALSCLIGVGIGSAVTWRVAGDKAGPQAAALVAFVSSRFSDTNSGRDASFPATDFTLPDDIGAAGTETEPASLVPDTEDSGLLDEAALLKEIDKRFSHPDDPQKPPGSFMGASDVALQVIDANEAREIMELAVPLAEKHADTPRYLFGLARLAYAQGHTQDAARMFAAAAGNGSIAARHYLGEIALIDGDIRIAAQHFEAAVNGGFRPSRPRWEELSAQIKSMTITPSSMGNSVLIQALLDGNFNQLNTSQADRLWHLLCVKEMAAAITDSGIAGLNFGDPNAQLIQLDPGLPARAELELSRPQNVMTMMGVGLGVMAESFEAGVTAARRSSGGREMGFMDLMNGLATYGFKTQEFSARVEAMKARAQIDGRVLASAYRAGAREDVRRLYGNMKRFVDGH